MQQLRGRMSILTLRAKWDDPELTLVGYLVDLEEHVAGLFLFNHVCGTVKGDPEL